MRRIALFALVPLMLLGACDDDEAISAAPPPQALSRDAVGHFCGMIVADHEGPKAQILVAGRDQPYWFASVRDAKAFTLLPDEPRDIVAIYVTDMARAESWEKPGPAWMAAEKGHYVLGSSRMGGMGQPEAVPFSTAEAAQAFATAYGGQVVDWASIPQSYVLGTTPG